MAGEHKAALSEIYQMSDGAEPEQFDAALTEARDEGNLSWGGRVWTAPRLVRSA